MPPSLPYHEAAVAISGVFEILGALGLLFQRTRRMAGIGLFVLTRRCVTGKYLYVAEPGAFPGRIRDSTYRSLGNTAVVTRLYLVVNYGRYKN